MSGYGQDMDSPRSSPVTWTLLPLPLELSPIFPAIARSTNFARIGHDRDVVTTDELPLISPPFSKPVSEWMVLMVVGHCCCTCCQPCQPAPTCCRRCGWLCGCLWRNRGRCLAMACITGACGLGRRVFDVGKALHRCSTLRWAAACSHSPSLPFYYSIRLGRVLISILRESSRLHQEPLP